VIGKINPLNLVGVWLFVVLFLSSCTTTSPGYITGVAREPIDHEQVDVYSKPPQRYEIVGYVEGWQSIDPFLTSEGVDRRALLAMRKNAAKMGANGVILNSIDHERIYTGGQYATSLFRVASGWSIYASGEENTSEFTGNEHEAKRNETIQIYIEPPDNHKVLGEVISRQKCESYMLTPLLGTKGAIVKSIEDLKQQAIKMGGNGLYVSRISRVKEYEKADLVDTLLSDKSLGEITNERMFYVFSGQAIDVSNGN